VFDYQDPKLRLHGLGFGFLAYELKEYN